MQLGGLQVCIGQRAYIRSMAGWIRACITSSGLTLVSELRGGHRLWRKKLSLSLSLQQEEALALSLQQEEALSLSFSLGSAQEGKAMLPPLESISLLLYLLPRGKAPYTGVGAENRPSPNLFLMQATGSPSPRMFFLSLHAAL